MALPTQWLLHLLPPTRTESTPPLRRTPAPWRRCELACGWATLHRALQRVTRVTPRPRSSPVRCLGLQHRTTPATCEPPLHVPTPPQLERVASLCARGSRPRQPQPRSHRPRVRAVRVTPGQLPRAPAQCPCRRRLDGSTPRARRQSMTQRASDACTGPSAGCREDQAPTPARAEPAVRSRGHQHQAAATVAACSVLMLPVQLLVLPLQLVHGEERLLSEGQRRPVQASMPQGCYPPPPPRRSSRQQVLGWWKQRAQASASRRQLWAAVREGELAPAAVV